MAASEGGSELSVGRLEHGADQHSSHRKSGGDAFGHGDEVGPDAGVLVSEEASGASVARLYFVENQHCAVGVALLAHHPEEVGRGNPDSAHTLHSFDYDGRHVAFAQFGAHGVDVVERQEGDVAVVVDRRHYLRIVGRFHRGRSAPVESFPEGHDALASGVERGEFQGVFVGLGARVDQKQLVVVVAAHLAEAFGQLCLEVVDYRIGVKYQLFGLLLDGFHHCGVGVSHRHHGMSAVEVEIFLSFGVGDAASASRHYVDVE